MQFKVISDHLLTCHAQVGNARVAGLEKDLGLHGYQYNISLTVFYSK